MIDNLFEFLLLNLNLFHRIEPKLDQFIDFHQYDQYLLGNDSDNDEISENNQSDQSNDPFPFGELSIKQEIDIDLDVKIETVEEDFNRNDHAENFNVQDPLMPLDDQQDSATVAENADSKNKSTDEHLASKRKIQSKKRPKQTVAKTVKNKQNLRLNQLKRFKCDDCSYTTVRKSDIARHSRTHTGEKPFKCELCFKEFSDKWNLKTHMRTHGNEFPFQCSSCRQGFSFEKDLKSHKNCNQKRFECDLCQYISFKKSDIGRHMNVHSDKKPFQCKICAKRFNRNVNLKRHIRIHANRCLVCRQGFSHRN